MRITCLSRVASRCPGRHSPQYNSVRMVARTFGFREFNAPTQSGVVAGKTRPLSGIKAIGAGKTRPYNVGRIFIQGPLVRATRVICLSPFSME
jgi:hypothetical protein